jgi:hypothetical protein
MQINQATQAGHIYRMQSQPSAAQKSDNGITSTQAASDQVSIRPAGRNAEGNWQAIADKYDVENISMRERGAMAQEFLDNGLISSEEAMVMSRPYKLNDDLDTKRNWLDISQGALEFAKQNGSPTKTTELMKRTVYILEQLQALAGNSDNNRENAMNRASSENQD